IRSMLSSHSCWITTAGAPPGITLQQCRNCRKVRQAAARPAKLCASQRFQINAVALKGINDDEIPEMTPWAHGESMDLTLIEMMPLDRPKAAAPAPPPYGIS